MCGNEKGTLTNFKYVIAIQSDNQAAFKAPSSYVINSMLIWKANTLARKEYESVHAPF